jgi:hypothetical protein
MNTENLTGFHVMQIQHDADCPAVDSGVGCNCKSDTVMIDCTDLSDAEIAELLTSKTGVEI